MTQNTPDRYRVRPRVWIGIAIYLAYVVVVFAVQQLSGIAYTDLGESGVNLFLGAGLSLIVGGIIEIVAIIVALAGVAFVIPGADERIPAPATTVTA